jgi:hypothetical protein
MPKLLLTIAQSGHDAQASPVSGMQTLLPVHGGSDQALLFRGAQELKGATINSAILSTRVAFDGGVFFVGSTTWIKYACENADAPLPFTEAEPFANFTARPRTAYVDDVRSGAVIMTQGQDFDSPNLASIVQTVVNRPSWSDGLHVFSEVPGFSAPQVWTYDQHPTAAPELLIDYTPAFGPSIFEKCLDAVLAKIQALPLTGIDPLNWHKRKFPWNRATLQPGGFVTPMNDRWVPATNESDDVEYPIQVTVVRASNQDLELNLSSHLLWREQIRHALLPRAGFPALAGVSEVINVIVEPGPVFDSGAFANQYDVGALIVRCIARERRGLT